MRTSTPSSVIDTHTAPEAMQSRTKTPPTAWTASASTRMYSSGSSMPEAVSTCGAKTTAGRSRSIAATTSAMGAGDHAACTSSESGTAGRTTVSLAIDPASRICDQRNEKSPLRMTRHFFPVAI